MGQTFWDFMKPIMCQIPGTLILISCRWQTVQRW